MDKIEQLKKSNYVLLGLIIFGLIFLVCVFFCFQDLKKNLNSFFFIAALSGSLLLYADFFNPKKEKYFGGGWITLIVLAGVYCFYNNILFVVLLFWILGLLHFIVATFFSKKNRTMYVNYVCIYLSLPLFVFISNFFLGLSGHHHPFVKDEFLMAIDGTLGIYPSLIMGRFYFLLPDFLNLIARVIYYALPLAFIIMYKIRSSLEREPPLDLIIEFILIGVVGFALYNLVPACGSRFAFQSVWPYALPIDLLKEGPRLMFCPVSYPRNCVPSLHTAWIVCLFRSGWQCNQATKRFVSILGVGTFVAMFGPGAHYFVDIIVGFAFANCIGGLSAHKVSLKEPSRWQAIGLGFLLCIAWYVIIFYGLAFLQVSKILAWMLFLGSILLGVRIEFSLIKCLNIKKNETLEKKFLLERDEIYSVLL